MATQTFTRKSYVYHLSITTMEDMGVDICDNGQAVSNFYGQAEYDQILSCLTNHQRKVVLLLNDDVEPIAAGWLHRMVDAVLAPDVGAVGARLVYPEGPIQHAGVILGLGGVCGHLWKGLPADEAARNPYVVYPGARLAVTGACLAVRREAFDQVGGLDEQAFPVAYNDIDFCLRLHAAGYRNIYRGDVVLVHYESQSRGHDNETSRRRLRLARETGQFLKRWRRMIEDDPFGSPEFDSTIESGAVHRLALASVRNED